MAVTDTAERIMRGMVSTLRENVGGSASIDNYVNALDTSASLELAGFGLTDSAGEGTKIYIGEDQPNDVVFPNIGLTLVDAQFVPDDIGGFYDMTEEYEALVGVREDCVTSGTALLTPAQIYRALILYCQAVGNCLQDRLAADLSSAGVYRCDIIGIVPISDGFGPDDNPWAIRFGRVRLRVSRTYNMNQA